MQKLLAKYELFCRNFEDIDFMLLFFFQSKWVLTPDTQVHQLIFSILFSSSKEHKQNIQLDSNVGTA